MSAILILVLDNTLNMSTIFHKQSQCLKYYNRQTKETFEVIVTELKWFQYFNEALLDSPLKFILPGLKTRKKALLLYESFPGYKENAEKYGVLKIGFKLK